MPDSAIHHKIKLFIISQYRPSIVKAPRVMAVSDWFRKSHVDLLSYFACVDSLIIFCSIWIGCSKKLSFTHKLKRDLRHCTVSNFDTTWRLLLRQLKPIFLLLVLVNNITSVLFWFRWFIIIFDRILKGNCVVITSNIVHAVTSDSTFVALPYFLSCAALGMKIHFPVLKDYL